MEGDGSRGREREGDRIESTPDRCDLPTIASLALVIDQGNISTPSLTFCVPSHLRTPAKMASPPALSHSPPKNASSSSGKKFEHLTTHSQYSSLLSSYDVWLFDCDGVLWSGDDLIPGAVSVLEKLRKRGKEIVFVTNNASKSRGSYLKKFEKLGIKAEVVSQRASERERAGERERE